MNRSSLALLALVPALLFPVSGSAEPPSGADCGEVERLQTQILKLRQDVRVGEVEIRRLRQEIERLRSGAGSLPPDSLSSAGVSSEPIGGSSQGESLGESPQNLEIEEIEEVEVEDLDLEEVDLSKDTDLETNLQETVDSSSASLDLYDAAYADFHQRKYPEALEKFERYLAVYGETDLADNAQFWIGAVHKALGDPETALEAFTKTVAEFPQGNKVPDALLEAGECLLQLKEIDGAREAWRELIRRYPDSAAAALAAERLENLP